MTTATKQRECVSGADPDATYRVPMGFGDFFPAPDLENVAERILEEKFSQWPEDEGRPTIAFFYKAKGGAKGNKATFGKTTKASGLVGALTGRDYVIWLAADHIRALRFTNYQVEALIYHELLHISIEVEDQDEDGTGTLKLAIRGHDVEAFAEEINEYGLWELGLRNFARSIQGRLSLGEA